MEADTTQGQRGRQERIQAPGERASTTTREGCRGTTRPEGYHRHRNGGAAMHRHRERAGRRGRNGTGRHRAAGTGPRSVTAAERRGRKEPVPSSSPAHPWLHRRCRHVPPLSTGPRAAQVPACARDRACAQWRGLRWARGQRGHREQRRQNECCRQRERRGRAGAGGRETQSGAPRAAQSPSRRGPKAQSTLRYCGAV